MTNIAPMKSSLPRGGTHASHIDAGSDPEPAATNERRRAQQLPLASTLALATGAGLGVGALLLRARGAGWSPAALSVGAIRGAGAGVAIGAALIGIDHLSGGTIKRQLDVVSVDRRAKIWFALSHPTKPWLTPLGIGAARDGRAVQLEQFGPKEPLDGAQDAFRHTYTTALFALRTMREHGVEPAAAHELAIAAGDAHEADGHATNDHWSREMDYANNAAGIRVLGDGRPRADEAADAVGFLTEDALRERVFAAMVRGDVTIVDRNASGGPAFRATTSDDLPVRARQP